MRRKLFILFILSAGVVFSFGTGSAQDDMEMLDNSVFERPVMAPALFAHDAHNEKAGIDDCAVCHHVVENGIPSDTETSEDQPCVDCHAVARAKDNPIALRRAYHLRCKGCHQAEKAGPVMCAGCHPRRATVK